MKLTNLERRVLKYQGMPAKDVARVEHLTLDEVMEVRAQLRSRGHGPSLVEAQPEPHVEEQMTLGQVDRMMRDNRSPQAADAGIGWTTVTDPDGW